MSTFKELAINRARSTVRHDRIEPDLHTHYLKPIGPLTRDDDEDENHHLIRHRPDPVEPEKKEAEKPVRRRRSRRNLSPEERKPKIDWDKVNAKAEKYATGPVKKFHEYSTQETHEPDKIEHLQAEPEHRLVHKQVKRYHLLHHVIKHIGHFLRHKPTANDSPIIQASSKLQPYLRRYVKEFKQLGHKLTQRYGTDSILPAARNGVYAYRGKAWRTKRINPRKIHAWIKAKA